ncbi:Protein roadkill [Araneus ventricosus]|uniref:Protein roadkill n=1 Tax=Araneus ventricosus TaxID=182803 RepID=A0A4Y2DEE7_ARAVE|nr:Protein roadkill [Araneus ventricosus]
MAQKAMTKCSISTESKAMHEIRMTVENVSKLPLSTSVTGPDFDLTPECMCRISFQRSASCLYVCIRNKSATEIKIQRSLVLYDCNNIKLHEERNERIFSLRKDEDVDVIGNVTNRNDFETLTNDTLIIYLYITIVETVRKKANLFVGDTDPERKLREDFKAMLENPVNSDVSLQVGDERIPAHWAVLCSRSPYFKKMFESKMQERVQNSVTITDISVTTLKNLVEFLYTAYFFENEKGGDMEELFELYYAADKYEVMDLRILCASKIMSNASADNVGQILQLAHRHNDKDLKMQAMGFIQFHSDEVFQTDGWKKFEAYEPLTAEAFIFCLKKN